MVQKTSLFYVRSVPLPFLHLAKGNSRQNSRRANRRRLPAFGSRSLGPGFKINDVTLAEFQDIRNCSRLFVWEAGATVGEFRDGMVSGQGSDTDPDGRNYVGEFRNGARDGQGTEYSADGSVLQSGISALAEAAGMNSCAAAKLFNMNGFHYHPIVRLA